MKLRDFVSKSLVEILNGVQDAKALRPDGVVPAIAARKTTEVVATGATEFQVVEFEVTVKVDSNSGREAELSVTSAIFGGGGIKSIFGKSEGHVATLRFKVPILLGK